MPWECPTCGAVALADDAPCSACGVAKTAWTVVVDRTRTLQVTARSFRVYRGDGTDPVPADVGYDAVALLEATRATSVPKDTLRQLAADGQLPPSAWVLFAVLKNKGQPADVTLEAMFAAQPSVEHVVASEPGPAGDPRGFARYLCTHGEGELDPAAFPGLCLVDLGEDTPERLAPTVEVSALGKPPVELPVSDRVMRRFRFSA